jgi:hypothetical protein
MKILNLTKSTLNSEDIVKKEIGNWPQREDSPNLSI